MIPETLAWIPTAVAIAVIVTRYLTVLEPLWSWLPDKWRWAPPTAIVAADVIVNQLPQAATAVDAVETLLRAAVVVALAAAAGLHGPREVIE